VPSAALTSCNSDITPHLVDTVLTAAIKDHLSDPTVLALLNTLVKATALKVRFSHRLHFRDAYGMLAFDSQSSLAEHSSTSEILQAL